MTRIATYDDWAQHIAWGVSTGQVILTQDDLMHTHLYAAGYPGPKKGETVAPDRVMEVLNRAAPENMARWN